MVSLLFFFKKKPTLPKPVSIEINILWAAHQVHHSAEDYNLTTAMRQSMMQAFGNWVSAFCFHHSNNLLFLLHSAFLSSDGLFGSATNTFDCAQPIQLIVRTFTNIPIFFKL